MPIQRDPGHRREAPQILAPNPLLSSPFLPLCTSTSLLKSLSSQSSLDDKYPPLMELDQNTPLRLLCQMMKLFRHQHISAKFWRVDKTLCQGSTFIHYNWLGLHSATAAKRAGKIEEVANGYLPQTKIYLCLLGIALEDPHWLKYQRIGVDGQRALVNRLLERLNTNQPYLGMPWASQVDNELKKTVEKFMSMLRPIAVSSLRKIIGIAEAPPAEAPPLTRQSQQKRGAPS
jgi:hypothetical protein